MRKAVGLHDLLRIDLLGQLGFLEEVLLDWVQRRSVRVVDKVHELTQGLLHLLRVLTVTMITRVEKNMEI